MTAHLSKPAGTSQCDAILAELQARPGEWVGLFDLYLASGSMAVHSRIADLRARGHHIDQRSDRTSSRVLSYYRLRTTETPQT